MEIINKNKFTELVADEGMYLTQVKDVEILERIVASKVSLSKHSTEDTWKEITKEEGDAIILEQERITKEQEEARYQSELTQIPY